MPKQIHSWQNLFSACRAFFETGPKKTQPGQKKPVPFLWWPPVINQPRHAGNVHENQSFRGVAGFNNPPNM
jgi:hypothetical protein